MDLKKERENLPEQEDWEKLGQDQASFKTNVWGGVRVIA